MTSVFMKSKRVQTVLLNGLLEPPPPVYYSDDVTVDNGDLTVEIIEDIEVTVCQED